MKFKVLYYKNIFLPAVFLFLISCGKPEHSHQPEVSGELMQWHKIVLLFNGPDAGENDSINPFLRYRLNVTFSRGNEKFTVPGYYAADGNAAESGADHGNKWKVIFCPDNYGIWNYSVSFRAGINIAVSDDPEAGRKVFADGYKGQLTVLPSNATGDDFRAKGRLVYNGSHYLHFAGNGKVFLKAGADSPENFLAYRDFDGTYYGGWNDSVRSGEAKPYRQLHQYEPHLHDWKPGDPTWRNGKGKGIIGALNYLSSKGMNSVYMLTNNVEGDGRDVFPWTTYNSDFTRFDVSKLEQWEIVFDYMDKLGIMCHFVTQENENQLLLDSGKLGLTRKLYYRELIARFGHHLGVTWNLGEENGPTSTSPQGQTNQERRDMARYFKTHDPYRNFVVVHTHSVREDRYRILNDLLGFPYIDGPSLQTMPEDVHEETIHWRTSSEQKGRKWVICSDEIGPADTGAKPDLNDPMHNALRSEVLWGNLMGGGGGVEWYFGYNYPNNDLNCEDWRSRDKLWNQTRIAISFFQKYLPFSVMIPDDSLVSPKGVYCLAAPDSLYAIYIPDHAECTLKTGDNRVYKTDWYDPLNGGELIPGDTIQSDSTGILRIVGMENININHDWTLMVKRLKE